MSIAIYATKTLEDTPARLTRFLVTVAQNRSVRLALAKYGYDKAEHDRGWALLEKVCRFELDGEPEATVNHLEELVEIDARDEQDFRMVHATLWHRFPEQARFVLTGIGPAEGAAAANGMKQLLDRLDALEAAPEREATRKEDHAALALIATRGFGKVERETLRGKVNRALDGGATESAKRVREDERRKLLRPLLLEVRAWYDEWHDLADLAVKRDDQKKALGLGR